MVGKKATVPVRIRDENKSIWFLKSIRVKEIELGAASDPAAGFTAALINSQVLARDIPRICVGRILNI